MDPDRFKSVEEKRIRLEQLKQMRLQLGGPRSSTPSSVPVVARAPLKVLIATQTDPVELTPTATPTVLEEDEPELTRFDKAIQTTWAPVVEPSPPQSIETNEPPAQPHPITVYIPQVPPPTQFERFIAARPQAQPMTVDTTATLTPVISDSGLRYRKPVSMDASPHFPELMVVAFSSKSTAQPGDLAGAAMVYSVDDMAPKFLLSCMLPLTVIRFDTLDSRRVIGAGSDGLVVIWDLNALSSLEVALWPQLATPLRRIDQLILDVSYIPHRLAIVAIHQYTIEGSHHLVLVLADGVINTWSPNLLACPKQDLALVTATSLTPGEVEPVFLKSLVVVETGDVDNLDSQSSLERLVIVEENGTIYRCTDDRNREFAVVVDPEVLVSDTVALLEKTLVSTHHDNSMRLWGVKDSTVIPLHSLRTDLTVVKIARRLASQIATLGINRQNHQVLELWDLSKSVRPIVSTTSTDAVSAVQFSTNGSTLLVGLDLGQVIKYALDEAQLNQTLSELKPEGIQALEGF